MHIYIADAYVIITSFIHTNAYHLSEELGRYTQAADRVQQHHNGTRIHGHARSKYVRTETEKTNATLCPCPVGHAATDTGTPPVTYVRAAAALTEVVISTTARAPCTRPWRSCRWAS
jgi:hypothetical protein